MYRPRMPDVVREGGFARCDAGHQKDDGGLRQRGVFAFELVPGLLASSLVNQYLDIKERNLL